MFLTEVDVANRALQHCGALRIGAFTDNSKNAAEAAFAYDKVRRAELRRNVWRFATRRAVLRPLTATAYFFAPPAWSGTTTYSVGMIVEDASGILWKCVSQLTTGGTAPVTPSWEQYFGPLVVDVYAAGTTYYPGDLVYTTGGTGSFNLYLCTTNANTGNTPGAPAYSSGATYNIGQLVTVSDTIYQSLVNGNVGNAPADSADQWTDTITSQSYANGWTGPLGGTLSPVIFTSPLGVIAGTPSPTVKTIFLLPYGFLREAPQDPKVASAPYLGTSAGVAYTDWEFEGNFIITSQLGPVFFRFVADLVDVSEMDDMFCEGFAARLALELVEPLTQNPQKFQMVAEVYKSYMHEARMINRIEIGSTEPREEDFDTTPSPVSNTSSQGGAPTSRGQPGR